MTNEDIEPEIRNGREWALWWERSNFSHSHALNDELDTCGSLQEKRVLYQTFTKEEQNGLMPEYCRRATDRDCPVGSMVKGRYSDSYFVTYKTSDSSMTNIVSTESTAMVIGQGEHGSTVRQLMLYTPILDKEGRKIIWAEAHSSSLKVIK